MTQGSLFGEAAHLLMLPALEIRPITHRVGQIRHILAPAQTVLVDKTSRFALSKRRPELLLHLSNDESVLVTERAKLARPAGIDGVLRKLDDGTYRWLAHKHIEAFDADIAKRGWEAIAGEITQAWNGMFTYRHEVQEPDGRVAAGNEGLRPPQLGALHAIGAHWSIGHTPATIVMPTGTGKTETMLSTVVAYLQKTLLVVVPYDILRGQTARKFLSLGLLRALNVLDVSAPNPIVGIVTRRPHTVDELDFFAKCHVVVGTMSALGEGDALPLAKEIAERVETLIVDEAHHLGADGWTRFREAFTQCKVLQFTATPFRRDGKLVDGTVIYNYPLRMAQRDNYFKKISFVPVYELDADKGDQMVAQAAVKALRADLAQGLNHLAMARCINIKRAEHVFALYQALAPDMNPILVHSEMDDTDGRIADLRAGRNRIAICVNMLGEGFDLPELKIAAIHDMHRSLAPLLQFTGRFTRTTIGNVGDATVVANIADPDVPAALERLYSEDADWNELLSELSSDAARQHAELVEFLQQSKRLDAESDDEKTSISHQLLRPTLGTLIYRAEKFEPKRFHEGIPQEFEVRQVWLNEKSKTLFFVTRIDNALKWTRSKEVRDRQWALFVLHFDAKRKLLYLSSTDKESSFGELARAVGGTDLIAGDAIFRSLGRINRLVFQSVGVKKHGRRNLRYAMYTGADVAEALSVSERAGSVKSNLSGSGWEDGYPVTIGCSYKGRIWSKERGPIPRFIKWCENVGAKIVDDTIDTKNIIANVLIPEEQTTLPDKPVLGIEWPMELLSQSDERVDLKQAGREQPLSMFGILATGTDLMTNTLTFSVTSADTTISGDFALTVGGADGYAVRQTTGASITVLSGRLETPLEVLLSDYPPLVRFIDLTELDGNLLIRPQSIHALSIAEERFEAWDWDGVDITKESIWKDGNVRQDSIQWRAAQHFIDGAFDVVFDDDGAGEAGDLVCIKEEIDHLRLALVHCKFSGGAEAGERIKDVVEVSSQAIRSAKWKWKFKNLCSHIMGREKRLATLARPTRFLAGRAADLNRFVKVSRFKEIRLEILIVQPGLSRTARSLEQTTVLASALSYLKETVGIDLDVICSA